MKAYLASKFENKLLINCFGELLQYKIGLELTNDWSNTNQIASLQDRALKDYGDIDRSDILIAIAPFMCGATSEMGYALGMGKKVFYLVDSIFYRNSVSSSWGEQYPLPSGLLSDIYIKSNDDKKWILDKISIDVNSKGWIVHSVEDMIFIINMIKK